MLMQQRNRANKREVLCMVTAHARQPVGELQLMRKGVGHEQRFQQALRVLMKLQNRTPGFAFVQAFDGLRFPLQTVNRLCLLALFVHRQHQAAVQQFFIQVDGRGCQKDHDRAFHAVLMRDQLARCRIFAGGCDRQPAFALQQL